MNWTVFWSSVGSLLLTLTVTTIFNHFKGLPKKIKDEKEAERKAQEKLMEDNECRDKKLAALEESDKKLKEADKNILELCREIQADVKQNRVDVIAKLERLENRERNALRAKILDEYRLYTDESRNPMLAWSEMEEHSFFKLVEDYEALGGNDYVHSVVIPEVSELDVVPMSNLSQLKELYDSRKIK